MEGLTFSKVQLHQLELEQMVKNVEEMVMGVEILPLVYWEGGEHPSRLH